MTPVRMLLTGVLVFGVLASGSLDFRASAQDAQEPAFRAASDVVSVYTTVVGSDGRLVTTLTRDDFEVRDEGKPQPIVVFDNTPKPIRLIALFDLSGSMVGNLPLLRSGARELFSRLGPDDKARVGTFGDEITISPEFTRDAAALEAALPTSMTASWTPLWRAVDQALDTFEDTEGARPVILVLSDGKDTGPAGAGWRTRLVTQPEIIERSRDENVMIYAVEMRSRGGGVAPGIGVGGLQAMMTADLPDPGLARVAEESGGGFIEINYRQNLGEAFAQVMDELHSQYLLGFEPTVRNGKVRDIEVRVKARDMKARARKSYRAPNSAR